MRRTKRCSSSLEPEILEFIERYRRRYGLPTRSDALRAIVRSVSLEENWRASGTVYGIITLLYDHHGAQTMRLLARQQHDSPVKILVTQHLHVSHRLCLETITACGPARKLEALCAALCAVPGVKRCSLSRAASARDLAL